jgi:hypothetical protein
MEITTRQYAIDNNMTRYFTGEPCKHGHNTERYTANGGCVECVNPTNNVRSKNLSPEVLVLEKERADRAERKLAVRQLEAQIKLDNARLREENRILKLSREDRISTATDLRVSRKQALAGMRPIKIMVRSAQLDTFKEILLTMAQSHCPTLVLADVVLNYYPVAGVVYQFRCFPDDEMALRAIGEELWKTNDGQLGIIARERALAMAQAEEDAEIEARWPTHDPI